MPQLRRYHAHARLTTPSPGPRVCYHSFSMKHRLALLLCLPLLAHRPKLRTCASGWSDLSRRARRRGGGRAVAAERLLFRRRRRRRLEDHATAAHRGLNVSDGFFKTASVGAIAVADSDPNVIYVGMGEACVRGNASNGDGVYKSVDGGKTWRNVGLQDSYHIGAVRVHPKNPDIVYVAALGHLWGPNEMRGVYRTTDGGATWKQVFTRGPDAGAVDLAFDPSNPRVLYAGFWQVRRNPYHFDSGGPGSGLFKSTDGGDTWTDISRAPGLPQGRARAASASPCRRRIRSASGRWSRRPTAASSAPTTAAATGPGSTSRASCASAPGITRTSSPTRRTPTPCMR